MSGHFVCLFCSSEFKSKSKGKRHSVTHLPWYFGNILCLICEQRFEVKQKLLEHCDTKGHQRKLDAYEAPFDVKSVRRQFVELERCTYSQVIIGFIEENFTEREFFTNFDRPEGKIDSLNKKVVDTAESQTADLKNRLSKLEECVEQNTTQVQGYSKMLTLQRDISKVLKTVGQLVQVQRPQVSSEMLSALVTLSQEAVKMYQSPYQPRPKDA